MKDIKGYEGRYAVTENGQIWSYLSNKFLLPLDDGKGYLYVNISDKNHHRVSKKIHRIVAETFISNPNNLPCINHKDENRKNNSIDNLEWCDYHYNNTYGNRITKIIEKNTNNPAFSKPIKGINIKTKEEKIFPSISEAARFLGDIKRVSNITACLKGRQQTSYGYTWEYIEEIN